LGKGNVTGEMSTGASRISAKGKHKPFEATSASRFGAKPSAGKVPDFETPSTITGQDDGTDYFAEWRETGGLIGLPAPKTRSQDALRKVCVAWIAGDRPDWARDLIREGIAKIESDDPEQALAFRTAMMGRHVYA
jgi:hypothetical protein